VYLRKKNNMKKIGIAILAVVAVSLTSCQKSYVCECTTSDGFGSNYSSREISKTSKKTAKAICGNSTEIYTSPAAQGNGASTLMVTTTCELK
jgi:hypothetical protein